MSKVLDLANLLNEKISFKSLVEQSSSTSFRSPALFDKS